MSRDDAMYEMPPQHVQRVLDLDGSACDIVVGKVECVTWITPASVASFRARMRRRDAKVDELDPDGDPEAKPWHKPWESE